jgi:16S rRNA U516 pseudouridylate synthase RsuA-like enzyme
LNEDDRQKLLHGVSLEGKKGKFIKITFPWQKNKEIVSVVCEEGRNRFVKRMFRKLDYTVLELNRLSFAGIMLDVPPGKSRILTFSEIEQLKQKYTV